MARKSRKNTETEVQQAIKQPFRVGAYVRLSAVDKKQKGDSIENQQAIITAFIAEHSDFELIDLYIDNGLSGQTFERPAFTRMLADFENGKINCCITKDFSRLGRNAIDTGFYIEKFFPTNNIRFIAITDNYDSLDGQSGGIMISLKNLVNEAYALDIGRKIRATKQMNIRNGCFVGRMPPYGYLKSVEDKHKLVPDLDVAPIVKHIFQMAANGDGVTAISKWLIENDVLPPKRYLYSKGLATEKDASGSLHWNKSVIYSILKNQIYLGDMIQGKFKTCQSVEKALPKSECVVTKNTHEALISQKLFDSVQKLRGNGNYHGKTFDELREANPLLRKVFCGHCGRTMFRCKDKAGIYRFVCNTRQAYNLDDCVPNRILETEIKYILLETLRKQTAIFSSGNNNGVLKADNNANILRLQEVQTEINRNSNFLKGLYESLINDVITDTKYMQMKTSYETKINLLAEQKRQIQEATRLSILESSQKSKAVICVEILSSVEDLTADIVETLVEKILVFEDKRIEINFKFTDEIITREGVDSE